MAFRDCYVEMMIDLTKYKALEGGDSVTVVPACFESVKTNLQ